jgi:hypothetical protein
MSTESAAEDVSSEIQSPEAMNFTMHTSELCLALGSRCRGY